MLTGQLGNLRSNLRACGRLHRALIGDLIFAESGRALQQLRSTSFAVASAREGLRLRVCARAGLLKKRA